MRTRRSAALHWILFALTSTFLLNCSGKATEEDLLLWKNTKIGRIKIQKEVIQNSQQDFQIRARAVEVLVEYGHTYRARDALKEASDYLALLHHLIPASKPGQAKRGILRHLYAKKRTKRNKIRRYATRDFLFMTLQLLGPKEPALTTRIKRELLQWIFHDLDFTIPLNKKNRPQLIAMGTTFLMRVGYIENLRHLGASAAPPLIRLIMQGIEVHKIVSLLRDVKRKDVKRKLIKGIDALSRNPYYPVDLEFISMVASVRSDEAAVLLLELGTDKKRMGDEELRDTAVSFAKSLAKKSGSNVLLPHFYAAMARKISASERFKAALDILEMSGTSELEKLVLAFKNDGVYGITKEAQKENANNFLYFSFKIMSLGPSAVPPLLKALRTTNPIARAVAILSLKLIGDKRAVPALKLLVTDTRPLKELDDTLTIGRLSHNTIHAIPVFAKIHALKKALKLTDEEHHNIALAGCQNLADVGDELLKDMLKSVAVELMEIESGRVANKIGKPAGWLPVFGVKLNAAAEYGFAKMLYKHETGKALSMVPDLKKLYGELSRGLPKVEVSPDTDKTPEKRKKRRRRKRRRRR